MVQLRELQLSANLITEIPYWMPSSTMAVTLEKLHLQNNDISILPMDFHFLSTLSELKLENNTNLRTPPLSVCAGGAHSVLAYCAIRHRNFLQLVEAADRYQFALNMSGVFPKSHRVLTGGLGWLPAAEIEAFDDKVDRFVNVEAHCSDETTADRLFRALADSRERRVEAFRQGVFERFMKALELTEKEGWVGPSHFRTDVLRPWGPRKKFTRTYAISFEAFFGKGIEEGAIPQDIAANAFGAEPNIPSDYSLSVMRKYRPANMTPTASRSSAASQRSSAPKGLAAQKEEKIRQIHLGVAKGGRETGILAMGGHLGGVDAIAKPPPEVLYDPPVTGTAPGEEGFIPVAERMEIRAACGDASCAGPRLSPQVVLEAVRYQRGLFGRKTAVGEVVDYAAESIDARGVEVEPFTVSSFFQHPATLKGGDVSTMNEMDKFSRAIEEAAREGLGSAYKEYLSQAKLRAQQASTPTMASPAHSVMSPLSQMSEEMKHSEAQSEVDKVKMGVLSGQSKFKKLVIPSSRLYFGEVRGFVHLHTRHCPYHCDCHCHSRCWCCVHSSSDP